MNPLYKMFFCLAEKGEKKEREKNPDRFASYWYEVAKAELGVKEVPGEGNNPRIVEYHQATTLKATQDSVPWCASFVNWCLAVGGSKGTGSAASRSFLNWGRAVDLSKAIPGDVVVFSRGDKSWQGHVAFYAKHDDAYIWVLGGNQNNEVSITKYSKTKLLGIRRPVV